MPHVAREEQVVVPFSSEVLDELLVGALSDEIPGVVTIERGVGEGFGAYNATVKMGTDPGTVYGCTGISPVLALWGALQSAGCVEAEMDESGPLREPKNGRKPRE